MPIARVELDRFDDAILRVLAVEGRISATELARRIGLSKSPTQARMKRLEDAGIITGYRANLDPIRMGLAHVAFVEVKLSDTRESALREFNAAVRRIPEVEECHMLASNFDYLLKVRTSDIRRYRMVLGEKISGEQAEEWGLVYKCVEDADLMTEARALATKLANGPTVAYATMKRNIATALDQNLQMVLLAEAEGQRIAGATKDAMEGGMAFLQKRKAEFKGE